VYHTPPIEAPTACPMMAHRWALSCTGIRFDIGVLNSETAPVMPFFVVSGLSLCDPQTWEDGIPSPPWWAMQPMGVRTADAGMAFGTGRRPGEGFYVHSD